MMNKSTPATLRISARVCKVPLIASGKSNKEIAAALAVTLTTVKKHSSHIYGN